MGVGCGRRPVFWDTYRKKGRKCSRRPDFWDAYRTSDRQNPLIQPHREIEHEFAAVGVGGDDEVFVKGDHELADVETVVAGDGGVVRHDPEAAPARVGIARRIVHRPADEIGAVGVFRNVGENVAADHLVGVFQRTDVGEMEDVAAAFGGAGGNEEGNLEPIVNDVHGFPFFQRFQVDVGAHEEAAVGPVGLEDAGDC